MLGKLNQLIANFEKNYNKQISEIYKQLSGLKISKSKIESEIKSKIDYVSNSLKLSRSKFGDFLNSLNSLDPRKASKPQVDNQKRH